MLAINLVEVYFYVRGFTTPSFQFDELLLQCMVVGQTALLSIWVGLGRLPVTLRCFAALVFIEGCSLLIPIRCVASYLPTGYALGYYPKELFNTMLPVFLAVVVPLWIGRLFGLRIARLSEVETRDPTRRRFQFSIRCLLEWITIAAIFLGSLTYVIGKAEGLTVHMEWKRYAVNGACYAGMALGLAWAILGIRWSAVRVVAQAVFAFLPIRLLCQGTLLSPRAGFGDFALIAAILFPCLWYFRAIGCRIVWQFRMQSRGVPTIAAPPL
jgi:hypothetical protein